VSSAATVSSSVTVLVAVLILLSSPPAASGATWVEATLVVLPVDGLLVETIWVPLLLPLATGLMKLRLLLTATLGATPLPQPGPGRVSRPPSQIGRDEHGSLRQ
jgi:hypothetical protein